MGSAFHIPLIHVPGGLSRIILHRYRFSDPSNAWADAWATALLVEDSDTGMEVAVAHNLSVLMLIRDGDQWQSIASPAFVDEFGEELINESGIGQWASPNVRHAEEG